MSTNRSLLRLVASAATLVLVLAAPLAAGCGGGPSVPAGQRETRGNFIVAWLHGTPYEMGYQHGQLLRAELGEGMDYIENDALLSLQLQLAESMGLIELAESNSFAEIKEECRGLVDGANDGKWTYEKCMVLAFGDVLVDFALIGTPPGCSQMAAAGAATADGRLYHGRILDWDRVDYILKYPTIFVRRPLDGLPHAYVGFPGNLTPYTAINSAGVSVASNNIKARDATYHSNTGRSTIQLQANVVWHASTLDEAREIIAANPTMVQDVLFVADGNAADASVFEVGATCHGERRLSADGVVYVTNHFLAPETAGCDHQPPKEANVRRYERYRQLLEPGATDWAGSPSSYYGTFDPARVAAVLRDRHNPYTGVESAADVFDDGGESIATYGAVFAVVFDPARKWFWVGAGTVPIPQQPFVGFSLDELLGEPGATPVEPAVLEVQ
jgi:hypothetical protein